jgi:hypothetical protein
VGCCFVGLGGSLIIGELPEQGVALFRIERDLLLRGRFVGLKAGSNAFAEKTAFGVHDRLVFSIEDPTNLIFRVVIRVFILEIAELS